jgi:putative MFS transporter
MQTPAAASIAARIERLPICNFHRRFIALISLGAWFDFYDIFMMAYLGAALQNSHFLSLAQFRDVLAAGFLGMFVGSWIFGIGSDYFGRRTSFVWMLVIYSAATFLSAFAADPQQLIWLRFLAGLGIGAELVIIDTYVTEIVPRQARGLYIAITQLVGFCAIPIVALLSKLLVPTHWLLDGWRWVMIIGSLGALFAWLLRLRLPESPRWLETKGRHTEAERVAEQMEQEVQRAVGVDLPAPKPILVSENDRVPLLELWSTSYRGRTLMLIGLHLLQTVGIYGFANWAPTFLLQGGKSLAQSLDYGFLIALVSPIGPLIAIATAERLERKFAIVFLASAMALTGLAFALAKGPLAIVSIGALFTVFSYWISAAIHTYQAELFPTRARATGVGFTYSWSRLSAVFSTYIISALLPYGVFAVFAFIAIAMFGVSIIVGCFGPRTNAIAVEDLSA